MKISVIIPAYNAEKYIATTIESCLEQTLPPDEIIVVDDCSTDGTFEIAQKYPPPVKALRLEKNSGVSVARNRAVEASTGDWLAFLDADDWFLPQKLEMQRQCVRDHPDAVLVYTGAFLKPLDGPVTEIKFWPPSELAWRLRYTPLFLPSTVLLRRHAFDAVGGFDPAYPIDEDWDLGLRLAERFSTDAFAAVPTPLIMYNRVEGSLSSKIMPVVNAARRIVENRSLYHTSGLTRRLLRRRILAFNGYDQSLTLRGEGEDGYLHLMLRSLAFWPFPNKMLPLARYKFAAVMLAQHLGLWPNSHRAARTGQAEQKPAP
ncbi:MAG: glycosyltransferase family 2 protein [Terracidiphilus sp.]